jgi:hypothetical protein
METNLKEYAAIELSLSTYEERVRLRKAELALKRAQTIEKLKSLGISEEEIAALTLET